MLHSTLCVGLQSSQCLHTQIPGAFRLLQVISSHFQPSRSIAEVAQQMEEPQQDQQQLLKQQREHQQQQQQLQQQQPPQASIASPVAATASFVPPTGVKKTFYKRKLPCPPATEFSSAEGRLLFAEALQQGTMTGFFKLIEQYSMQDEPAFCGLASIAMVLNALSIDPKRPWKGSWRWFHEQLLDCCLPLATVAKEGVVLTQAACLAKCNGANVSLHRFGSFSLQEFRQAVADVCASGEQHLVVSYSRKAFSQTGDGHFSPVGGYHAARDLVLILDTARFKYPPHWVPLPMLFEAMSSVDLTTGQPRGFLRLSANTRPDSMLFTLDIRPDGSWREAEHFIKATAPELVQAAAGSGQLAAPEAAVARLVSMAPLASVRSFIAVRYAAQVVPRTAACPHREAAGAAGAARNATAPGYSASCEQMRPTCLQTCSSSSSSSSTSRRPPPPLPRAAPGAAHTARAAAAAAPCTG
ncbi:Phytochelatin synthase-domain-containing protein [Scenedesmus sp. NREL 46B-D3]|nr:Phytochelatin synthase-domain-containing protein [Scenedesmus sp. NREL 46B-D3]